jgi:hypothetical protein
MCRAASRRSQLPVDALDCPKEMWLYEEAFHPMGEVAGALNAAS